MQKFVVNKAIKWVQILRYNRGQHFSYSNGELKILDIPDNTVLYIKMYTSMDMCGTYVQHEVLWENGVLYKLS